MYKIKFEHSVAYDFVLSIARVTNIHESREYLKKFDSNLLEKFKQDEILTKWITRTNNSISEKYREIMDLLFNRESKWHILLIYYIHKNQITEIEELKDFVKTLEAKEMMKQLLKIFSDHSSVFPKPSNEEFEDMFNDQRKSMLFIEKTDFSPKRKWEWLQFFSDPQKVKDQMIDYLEWFYAEIFSKEVSKFDKITKKYEKELERKIKNYGDEYLKLLIKSDYSKENINKTIVLTISYFMEIGFLCLFMDNDDDLYVIGFRHMELFVERKHGTLANVHIFKALGDETRQNMIKLLAKKEFYGDQLAQEMGLSNSTVSYHLNILILEGFVFMKRVENRSYFFLDTKKLNEILNNAIKRMIE